MKIGIVGLGVVGRSMQALFGSKHELKVYDKFQEYDSKEAINACDLVFVSVSTPTISADGLTCDTSAVEECVGWITAPMCIRSTVPPGTTRRLSEERRDKHIAFCPEHLRETTWDKFENNFIIVGSDSGALSDLIIRAFQIVLGAQTKYAKTDPTTAELSKYMLNCYLATKVAFCNQFYDIADRNGVYYNDLRELWLLDERIGRSHTMITPERAYGGKCLPKDLRAMVAANPDATILKAVNEYNNTLTKGTKLCHCKPQR